MKKTENVSEALWLNIIELTKKGKLEWGLPKNRCSENYLALIWEKHGVNSHVKMLITLEWQAGDEVGPTLTIEHREGTSSTFVSETSVALSDLFRLVRKQCETKELREPSQKSPSPQEAERVAPNMFSVLEALEESGVPSVISPKRRT